MATVEMLAEKGVSVEYFMTLVALEHLVTRLQVLFENNSRRERLWAEWPCCCGRVLDGMERWFGRMERWFDEEVEELFGETVVKKFDVMIAKWLLNMKKEDIFQ